MSSEQANPQRITQKTAIDLYEDVEKLVNHLENEILTLELQQKQLTNSGNSGNNGYSGGKNVFNGNNKQNLRSTENGIVSNSTGTNPDLAEVIKDTSRWKEQLFNKMLCLYVKRGSIYLYHVRKAAGTTLRDILQFVAMRWSVSLYETEGNHTT